MTSNRLLAIRFTTSTAFPPMTSGSCILRDSNGAHNKATYHPIWQLKGSKSCANTSIWSWFSQGQIKQSKNICIYTCVYILHVYVYIYIHIPFQCITFHYIALHCIVLHCITPHDDNTIHYITLHCTTIYYIVLHYMTWTLHYTTYTSVIICVLFFFSLHSARDLSKSPACKTQAWKAAIADPWKSLSFSSTHWLPTQQTQKSL